MAMSLSSTSGGSSSRVSTASAADSTARTLAPDCSSTAATDSRAPAVGLLEGLEDVRQELRLDPLALVADGDDGLAVGAREPHEDAAAPGGELDGVREEVPHDLLEASRIALDRLRSELEDALHPDLLRLGVGTHRVERRLGDGREIDRPGIEDELPGRDARHVQELLDQLRLRDRAPLDRLDPARGPLRVELAAAQQARPHANRAERRAQLVRQHRHELVLQPVGLAQVARALLDDLLEELGVLLQERLLLLDPAPPLALLDG